MLLSQALRALEKGTPFRAQVPIYSQCASVLIFQSRSPVRVPRQCSQAANLPILSRVNQ